MEQLKEKLGKIWAKVKTWWKGLASVTKRFVLAAAGLLLVMAIVLTIYLNISANQYMVLFEGMSEEESTQVYLELKNKGVDTKINSDGEIEVPADQWDSLVYELAELGYPQSTPSYSVFFDNLGMTMTEFEKEQTLRFQLQDRLQQTLVRIDGIKSAVVNINIPEKSNYVWKNDDEKASASVLLTLNNSAGFTPENVSAVKKLVAYSAQKMDPKDVTVTDASTGNELMSEEESITDDTLMNREEQINYSNIVKNQYEYNAQKILSPIYGNDKVAAVASVVLDYDKITQEIKELITDENGEGVKANQQIEYGTDGTVNKGGIVGEEDNSDIPTYGQYEDNLNSDNSTYYKRDTEWAIGYVLTQKEKAQGVVSDATISVVVTTGTVPMSDSERQEVVQLVKNATNIPAEKISVFNTRDMAAEIPFEGKDGLSDSVKKTLLFAAIAAVILLLLFILLIRFISKRNKKKLLKYQTEAQAQISSLRETINETQRQSIADAASAHSQREKATAKEVREFVKQNPEVSAALIRSMLKNDE